METTGITNRRINAFAYMNKGEDVIVSLDGKKLAYWICDEGKENLTGFEISTTFEDRKHWF